MPAADAVELTIDAAWYVAERTGAGSFPWVLAMTPPYRDARERAALLARQDAELADLGVLVGGQVNPVVQQWISVVCRPQRWLDLRYVSTAMAVGDMLRGFVARRDGQTVVALRNAHLVTFSAVDVVAAYALTPMITVGLPGQTPASFDEFALPVVAGARADTRLRDGAVLTDVMDQLGIPDSARPVVRAVFEGPRHYVEIVAGHHVHARPVTTEVGIAVVDTAVGRVLVSPTRAYDGQWVSMFMPGSDSAITRALANLTACLPDGQWFSSCHPAQGCTT
ncbi:ESX secretion-associated protein EspG [Mycolicibacterium sp. CBM1]